MGEQIEQCSLLDCSKHGRSCTALAAATAGSVVSKVFNCQLSGDGQSCRELPVARPHPLAEQISYLLEAELRGLARLAQCRTPVMGHLYSQYSCRVGGATGSLSSLHSSLSSILLLSLPSSVMILRPFLNKTSWAINYLGVCVLENPNYDMLWMIINDTNCHLVQTLWNDIFKDFINNNTNNKIKYFTKNIRIKTFFVCLY